MSDGLEALRDLAHRKRRERFAEIACDTRRAFAFFAAMRPRLARRKLEGRASGVACSPPRPVVLPHAASPGAPREDRARDLAERESTACPARPESAAASQVERRRAAHRAFTSRPRREGVRGAALRYEPLWKERPSTGPRGRPLCSPTRRRGGAASRASRSVMRRRARFFAARCARHRGGVFRRRRSLRAAFRHLAALTSARAARRERRRRAALEAAGAARSRGLAALKALVERGRTRSARDALS